MKEDNSARLVLKVILVSISETSFIDNGLKERTPLTLADLEYEHENYIQQESGDPMNSTLDSALDQSTSTNRMAGQLVLDDCLERISAVSGENTPVHQHQEEDGLGFFMDFDDLIPEVAGVSGKSKPGVTVEHLSKIWRIDESAARQTKRLLRSY